MQIGCYLAAFIAVPIWSSLSDRKGRHILVLAISTGFILHTIALLAISLNPTTPLWVLFLGYIMQGLFGKGHYGLVFMSVIADLIPQGRRTFLMIVGTFFIHLSETASELTTGYWIKTSGFTPLILCCLVSHMIILFYGIIILSKCVPVAEHPPDEAGSSFLRTLKRYIVGPYRTYLSNRQGYTRISLLLVLIYVFLESMAMSGMEFLSTVYVVGPPLCWESVTIGIYHGIRLGLTAIVPLLLGVFTTKILAPTWLVFWALFGGLICSVTLALARRTMVMFIAVIFLSPHSLVRTISMAIIADLTHSYEHGK